MNKLVVVNICIVLLHKFILVDLTTEKKGLSGSSCRYSGDFDPKKNRCHKDAVKIRKLPDECTAFVFNGILSDAANLSIKPRYSEKNLVDLGKLIEEDDSSHAVYVFYKHELLYNFGVRMFYDDFEAEVTNVKDFIKNYAVKGFILDGIENAFTITEGDDFYKHFKAYVKTMKTENPGLEIGFYLSARNFIESINEGNTSYYWFDFGQMNDILDFFIIEFATFNECIDELLYGGITPLDSTNNNIMTLTKFADAFKKSTIDKEKVYFEFLISPIVKPEVVNNYCYCEISYNEYCENYEEYKSTWCVDPLDVLLMKGNFAKLHSKGFIGRNIDAVDRDEKCECRNQYMTFYMMLKGYNGDKDSLTCKKFE